jgi:hypothetical protein
MAVAFRASASVRNVLSPSISITIPAAAQIGDLLFAGVYHPPGTTVIPPVGWTLAHAPVGTANSIIDTYWKIAESGDPGSSKTWNSEEEDALIRALILLVYSGASSSAPIDTRGGASVTFGNSIQSHYTPLSLARSGDMIVTFWSYWANVLTVIPTIDDNGINTVREDPDPVGDQVWAGASDQPWPTPSDPTPQLLSVDLPENQIQLLSLTYAIGPDVGHWGVGYVRMGPN